VTLDSRSEAPILSAAMRHDRLVVITSLALACALAWLWLLDQAQGMGAARGAMGGMPMPKAPQPSAASWLGAFVMWSLMMVAMMLPSAAPMILIYTRVAGQRRAPSGAAAPALAFAAIYLVVWAAFSAVAALAQVLLAATGAISASRLSLGDARLAGAVLLLAGAYQLTPLKDPCLRQCRSPMGLIVQHWRPGWRGALGLGLRHALYCLGCCWALMALLFVGGVMNLAWVAALALVVMAEKVAPIGRLGARIVGVVCALAGVTLAAGLWAPPH
jgi:predicted metal-binding membrane protein